MNIIYQKDLAVFRLPPCVATLGFFDGVHLGHQSLIGHTVAAARREGMPSMVVTFDRHPSQVLGRSYKPQMLTTLDEKLRLIGALGADYALVLHFDKRLAGLSAEEFMLSLLYQQAGVRHLVIGYDNKFGSNRSAGFDDYQHYGRQIGMAVTRDEAFLLNDIEVSSSVVRAFLKEGEVALAAGCLGRPYSFSGSVTGGYQEGRKLGFPTANIEPADASLLIPAPGAYAVWVVLPDGSERQGMTNIGTRPTFDGHHQTIETNIFDFDSDLYGQQIAIRFVARLRDEQRFDSVTQLAQQLRQDELEARELLERGRR